MNLNQKLELIKLFGLYGATLTDKQIRVFKLYVLNDLSLAEVSNLFNISRQAVKYALDSATKSMKNLEKNLRFSKKLDKIKVELDRIKSQSDLNKIKVEIDKLLEEI